MRTSPIEVLEGRQLLSNVFTVINTKDDGLPGSLRWAIGQVNADAPDTAASPDQIRFNIPTTDTGYNTSTGAWTISVQSALPTITRPIVIDGYSQPGAIPNSSTIADDAILKIALRGPGFFQGDGLKVSGGNSTIEGLAIGGFAGAAVRLTGGGHDVIAGNFLGTDPTGLIATGNYQAVVVESSNNTVGGTTAAARDVASTGVYEDITVTGSSSSNLIAGNLIGLNAAGDSTFGGSALAGIYLVGGSSNTIGGTVAAARNVIAGQLTCIFENGGTGGRTLIQGNYTGTDATGTFSLSNVLYQADGIWTSGPRDTIGGSAAGAGNLVSGNQGNGIVVNGDLSLVQGNLVGTTLSGTGAFGNAKVGIILNGANQTVGGTVGGAANVIADNNIGIQIGGGSSASILGNRIGTDLTGSVPLGNVSDGIRILGEAPRNTIGGSAPGAGNVIADNGGAGVNIGPRGATPTGVSVLSNSIHDNAQLGIDLGGDGVTPNAPGGPHAGPNHLQNYPVLTAADSSAGSTTIIGTLNSTPNSTFTVQFFADSKADPSGHGQGKTYLGQLTGVKTDASGNAHFSFVAPVAVAGQFLSATATDPGGNTSEFAADIREGASPIADIAVTVDQAPVSQIFFAPISFSFLVTNKGPSTATDVVITDTLPAALAQATVTASQGTSSVVNGVFTAHVPSLASGDSVVVTVQQSSGSRGTITDELSATAAEPDPDPTNNSAEVSFELFGFSTTTTLSATPNPSNEGGAVTFTATTSGSDFFHLYGPAGDVTFSVDGKPAATVQLLNTSSLGQSAARFTTSSLAAGSHVVTAHFGGNFSQSPSDSAPVTQVVNVPMLTTSTTLNALANPSTFGQAVTFRATTTNMLSVAGSAPGGTVTFSVDGVPAATVPLTIDTMAIEEAFAFADFSTSSLVAGSHVITAHYNGDADNAPSDAKPVTQVVDRSATVTALAAIPSPAIGGRPATFTFTAFVAPAPLADGPTGAVTFFLDGIGYTVPLVPSADGRTGMATYTPPVLGVGTHAVVAVYNGDPNFAPSASSAIAETVSPAGPAPRLVEVLRYGYHAMPTALAVVFDTPLDPASAQDPTNYYLLGPQRIPVAIASAALGADGKTVVLQPRGRLNVHWTYTLTVIGTPSGGIRSAAGVHAGVDQIELITSRNLVRAPRPPAVAHREARPKPSARAVDAVLASGHLAHARVAAARRHRG